ncbi:MAG: NAD(P)-dependent glycerol-1-phosphate dehydrogenase, partial [Candidatus Methanoperedens sp.]|nr:NAD(P)-dependent glycerol-1-phosphate dehydrogenase [Candidatus Methanoperedens sp.]
MKESKENHKNKWMQLPRNVVVGHGVIRDTGKVCKDLKLNGTGLIAAGSSTLRAAGKAVEASLEESGFDVAVAVVESPALDEVRKVE